MLRLAAAALSLALHLLLGWTLLHVTATAPPPPPKHTAWNDEGAESARHLRGAESLVDVRPLADQGISGGTGACPDKSYVGIGIVVSAGLDVIMMIGTNTPASRAGLKEGDILLGVDWSKVVGAPEGTRVPLVVLRDATQFPVTLTVARICND